MKLTNCFACICLLFLSSKSFAENRRPNVENLPSWTTATSINYDASRFDSDAEDGYVDLHFEKQISLQEQAVFTKKAVHILSEAGVQNQSQISVDFDPAYQHLAFHTIRIIRGGNVINKLELSKIKTIQQEKELNRFLYNGALTAVLFLEDVRKDDIIEYSYTIKGFNPIFNNRYSDMLQLQFGVPVYQIFYRLVVPKGRTLNVKNNLMAVQPKVVENNAEKIYEWNVTDAAALHTETNIPSWHDAYAMVMVSEFGTWKEVADWAKTLFPFSANLPAGLRQKVNEIKSSNPTVESQLLAALRFVQDDVRYMGIEMGVNSHKPHAPLQIFNQRFGDCKDKAYLLSTLLRGLGIEAYPVLNNTFYKKTIATWQPMPTAFDHATVCVQLDGKMLWFDPTISYQRGPLQTISYPDYQTGLVIGNDSLGLSTIPLQDNGEINVKEIFTVKHMGGTAKLKVVTKYSGSFADNSRSDFSNSSLADIRKNYKNFYATYFKKLQIDSVSYKDDEQTGLFTTTEYYTVKDFWTEENKKTHVVLEPYLINSILKKPKEEERGMPFALSYPMHYHEEIEVELPEDWSIEEANTVIKDSAFSFQSQFKKLASDVVLLSYDYENLSDHVQPAQTAHFLKKMGDAEKNTAFELYSEKEQSTATPLYSSGGDSFTKAYVLLGLCVVGTYIYKRRRSRN